MVICFQLNFNVAFSVNLRRYIEDRVRKAAAGTLGGAVQLESGF
jgi:hypothetical protein